MWYNASEMIGLTEWVGIYGAILATGVFAYEFVKNRPRIKIDMWGIPAATRSEYEVTIVVINKSDYPIKLDYYGFIGKGIVSPHYPETDKPMLRVPARDQHILRFDLDDVALKLRISRSMYSSTSSRWTARGSPTREEYLGTY